MLFSLHCHAEFGDGKRSHRQTRGREQKRAISLSLVPRAKRKHIAESNCSWRKRSEKEGVRESPKRTQSVACPSNRAIRRKQGLSSVRKHPSGSLRRGCFAGRLVHLPVHLLALGVAIPRPVAPPAALELAALLAALAALGAGRRRR